MKWWRWGVFGANVAVKGNLLWGSLSKLVESWSLFSTPYHHWRALHTDVPTGHGVLAKFILTNTLSISHTEKCSRCWSKKTVGQSNSFWPSVFYLLSQLSAFGYDLSKPTTLVPSPFQLPAGSQRGAAKWVGDYHFPQCFVDSWWLPPTESHGKSCNPFLSFLSFCLGCKGVHF